MILICSKGFRIFVFLLISNNKKSVNDRYILIDIFKCETVLSISKSYMRVIMEEKTILDYKILIMYNWRLNGE